MVHQLVAVFFGKLMLALLDNRVEENAKFLHHEENCSDCHEGRLFEEYVQVMHTM